MPWPHVGQSHKGRNRYVLRHGQHDPLAVVHLHQPVGQERKPQGNHHGAQHV